MTTIRITIEPTWTVIDYTNGHKSEGHDVTIYEETHNGANSGQVATEWHTTSDDLQAIKRDLTRKLGTAGIVPLTESSYARAYCLLRWTDGKRSYRLPVRTNVYGDGIVPTMRVLLSGVDFL